MFLKLLKLEWKSFFRSASMGKGLGVKLLLGFLAIYFLLSFTGLGFGLYFIVKEQFPTVEPLVFVNSFLLLWFLGEFIIRFLMQNLPVMDVKPLLTQRLSRSKIVYTLLLKSFFSYFNLLTLAVAIPFAIVNLNKSDYTAIQLIFWLLAVIGFVYFLNYLNIWVQKRFDKGLKTLIPFILFVLALGMLEYFGLFSISGFFGHFFTTILRFPALGILPILLAFLFFRMVFVDLKKNLYLDAYLSTHEKNDQLADLSWLDKFGVLAPFVKLDLKLILRNKRAKNTLVLSFFFLFYGLIFYTNDSYSDSSVMFVFVGIFMTGIFVINFGQFIPAWDSSYFPLLRTQPFTQKNYLESKVLLMSGSIFILTLLGTFYAYFGWDKVYINVACAVYNLGVNVPIILLFGAYNRKRIDLTNGNMFNYQGTGAAQWLVSIPLLVLPLIIWGAFKFMFDQSTANIVLIVLGVIGLLLQRVIIKGIADLYLSKRYEMIEGFRQKD